MSFSFSPALITPEQFAALDIHPQRAPLPLLSPDEFDLLCDAQACRPMTFRQRIASMLLDNRGERLTWCRASWQWFTDGTHKWCRPSNPCDLVIACPECAQCQAIEQHKKYDALYAYIPDAGFTRLTFFPDMEDPKQTFDLLTKALRKRLPRMPTILKIKPASEHIEALYCGPLTEGACQAIRDLYPTMIIRPLSKGVFREELGLVLAPDLPKTPEAIAALDAKYIDVRLLRVQGLSQEQRKKLSVSTDAAIRDNFSSPPGKCAQHLDNGIVKPVPKCPHCGKFATKYTRWVSDGVTPPDDRHWQDVILYIPPPEIE